jgi:predicted DNA-binding transcriptional regulator
MARDRVIGAALVVGAIIGVIVYGLLVFADYWYQKNAPTGGFGVTMLVLQISAFVAILAILAILGWIGYVMATTPPPVPLEPEPAVASSSGAGTSSNAPTPTPAGSPDQKK